MKKVLLYFIGFIFICFILPAICTTPFEVDNSNKTVAENSIRIENTSNEKTGQTENVENAEYNYGEHTTIKLLHSEKREIEELPLDEYLYGVVSAEMPASYEIEALKAQAVVARTYTIYQIQNNALKHEGANICDSYACCQAWISKEERFENW